MYIDSVSAMNCIRTGLELKSVACPLSLNKYTDVNKDQEIYTIGTADEGPPDQAIYTIGTADESVYSVGKRPPKYPPNTGDQDIYTIGTADEGPPDQAIYTIGTADESIYSTGNLKHVRQAAEAAVLQEGLYDFGTDQDEFEDIYHQLKTGRLFVPLPR